MTQELTIFALHNEINDLRDEVRDLTAKLDKAREALEQISRTEWDDEPATSPQGFLRSVARRALAELED